ncbi:MAG: hypothetical protein LBS41_05000 [Streptococcaceae bacterium]|jgi:hypothetical protein|nr:hypothetical protein [Streptococcaceae bacterium]
MELAIMSYIVAVIGVILILTPIVLGVLGIYALGTFIFGNKEDDETKLSSMRLNQAIVESNKMIAEWNEEIRTKKNVEALKQASEK